MNELIIASTSKYRHQRLTDAGLRFSSLAPETDETPKAGEAPDALAKRLAKDKALSVASNIESGLVIGSDQVACLQQEGENHLLSKPGSWEKAKQQLQRCSGQLVSFFTGLHVEDVSKQTAVTTQATIDVQFRQLSEYQIDKYLNTDQPFDCAGSFKMEKAGILLFESVSSTDPNALIGLPMIALTSALKQLGYDVFDFLA